MEIVFQAVRLRVKTWAGNKFSVNDYFLIDSNNAQIQPTTDHPSSQLPMRMRAISVLSLPVCWARYAGAHKMATTKVIAITYLTKIIMFILIVQIWGTLCPPRCCFDYIPYFADVSSSSSILINWLYFAIRSVRDMEPVLI